MHAFTHITHTTNTHLWLVAFVPQQSGINFVREQLVSLLQTIFRRTGAVEIQTPLLAPAIKRSEFDEPVRLLDKTGSVVELPWNLTLAFARLVARASCGDVRRYHFGRLFREGIPGYQPEVCVCGVGDVCECMHVCSRTSWSSWKRLGLCQP